MKNTMKCLEAMRSIATQSRWLCAIALVAVIGFSFAACGDDDNNGGGNGGGGSGGGGGGGGGDTRTGSWPPGTLLAKYGLSGLSAPSGATDIYYAETINYGSSSYDSALMIMFDGPSSAETTVANWFGNNWTIWYDANTSEAHVRYYKKTGGFMAAFSYYKDDGDYMIMAYTGWDDGDYEDDEDDW